MNWKFSGDRPVYQQICELIRGAVLTGELKPGQRIPSVREIAPDCPDNEAGSFPYPIFRYPSLDVRKETGYMAGIPFSPELLRQLDKEEN